MRKLKRNVDKRKTNGSQILSEVKDLLRQILYSSVRFVFHFQCEQNLDKSPSLPFHED